MQHTKCAVPQNSRVPVFIPSYANTGTRVFPQQSHLSRVFLGCCLPSRRRARKTKPANRKASVRSKRAIVLRQGACSDTGIEPAERAVPRHLHTNTPPPRARTPSSPAAPGGTAGHVPADSARRRGGAATALLGSAYTDSISAKPTALPQGAIRTRAQGIKPARSCPYEPRQGNGSREKATGKKGSSRTPTTFSCMLG